MNTLERISQLIDPELTRLREQIEAQLHTDNQLMQQVILNYLKSKGKLIRPILVILSARLIGTVNDNVISAAAAVELLHNASLIHDDVVDTSSTRRGRPTINAVWDNHIAVLVGDFFVSSSMQQAISTGDVRIIDALCHLGKLLSIGELDQIYNARYHNISQDAYIRTINYKTASLFVACSRMGCYASGADDNHTEALARFTEYLGLCFQIRDDIFDYFPGTDNIIGKPICNDLREGKITLPLIHVLLDKSLPDNEAMTILANKEQLSEQEIMDLNAYAVNNGGIDYAYQFMSEMRTRAVRELAIFPDSPNRQALIDLFDYIIERRF
ncbi:MAG: polyprenyl synthetase family protein [Muribaculaceae bacterium]|nr:polyprenyl synthetase family protein [Muribaculaceae bacterium]